MDEQPRTITQEIADFIATEGDGRCWDALTIALARLKAAQQRIEQVEQERDDYYNAWQERALGDDDLFRVTGGARPSPDAGCRYAPMGGKCYPAAPLRGVNWPLSLRAQRTAKYGDK